MGLKKGHKKEFIKIVNKSPFDLPTYAYEGDAGIDLRAVIKERPRLEWIGDEFTIVDDVLRIEPFGRVVIPTGIFISLPRGLEAQIRSRSGLAAKQGLIVLNAPGTIDCNYRGEIGVILYNSSEYVQHITHGTRIAQMVIAEVIEAVWEEVDELDDTVRGGKGFGSSGTN